MSDELPDKVESPKDESLADESSRQGSLGLGIGYTVLLHMLQVPVVFLTPIGVISLFFIGLSQLVYMIPAIIYFKVRRETETAQGLIIGTCITFLLNAACTGIVLLSL